jgi:GntP family gluconate:H+ symporter
MMLAADAAHSDNNTVLVIAALLGIATVVVLITWLKLHPFLALILGSAVLGLVSGLGATPTVNSFTTGLGPDRDSASVPVRARRTSPIRPRT